MDVLEPRDREERRDLAWGVAVKPIGFSDEPAS